jgi:hypothetical protein
MHRLLKEEHMTRAEAASLWTAWEQTLKEFLSALGSPEGARARVVGAERDPPSRKYTVEQPKGTEVAVAVDAWLGTGLGGVAFALRQHAGGQRELTNGDIKSRMAQDRAILSGKKDPITYTREQLTTQRGNWDMVHARLTEQDLERRYGWSPRETRHTQPQGGPYFSAVSSTETGAVTGRNEAQAETTTPAVSKPDSPTPLTDLQAGTDCVENPPQEELPEQSERSSHDSEEEGPTSGPGQCPGGELSPGLPQYQE